MVKRASESVTVTGLDAGARDDDQSAVIRGDIQRTRGDMSRTVNEIEERLSPAHIKEHVANVTSDLEQRVGNLVSSELRQARSAVREATVGRVEHMVQDARESVTGAGTTVLDTIKANPIPTALIGLGLGWLLMSGRNSGNISAYRWPRERGMRSYRPRRARRELGRNAAGDVKERSRRVVGEARRQVVRAERGIESSLRDNPLALGAVALAVGAAIGLSLPHTRAEDEWMGDVKDRLIHRAEGAASEALHSAEEAAGRLASPDPQEKELRPQEQDKTGEPPNGLAGGSKSQAV